MTTVLAAEIAGARQLIEHLDPKRTRVGIVIFSGGARVIAPLGKLSRRDRRRTRRARVGRDSIRDDEHRRRPARGDPRRSRRRAAPGRGAPSLADPALRWNSRWTRSRSSRTRQRSSTPRLEAAEMGVRIHTFAIGARSWTGTDVYARISSRSGGHFVAIQKPADIALRLSRLNLTRLAEVVVANATTGEPGRATRLFPDGSFDGVVGLVPGENRITVAAQGPGGARQFAERVVVFERREPRDAAEVEAAREKLARLRRRTMETELALEIERSRDAEQDKQLDLLLDP